MFSPYCNAVALLESNHPSPLKSVSLNAGYHVSPTRTYPYFLPRSFCGSRLSCRLASAAAWALSIFMVPTTASPSGSPDIITSIMERPRLNHVEPPGMTLSICMLSGTSSGAASSPFACFVSHSLSPPTFSIASPVVAETPTNRLSGMACGNSSPM